MTNFPNEIDALHHIEKLAEGINHEMSKRNHFVLRRYPLTFALLALFGVVAVSEGAKGLLDEAGFKDHPLSLLLIGLVILSILGLVYKKLDKA